MSNELINNQSSRAIMIVAIDFGTGRTKVVVRLNDSTEEQIRGMALGDLFESAYFLDPATGREYFDVDALEQACATKDGKAVTRFKLDLGKAAKESPDGKPSAEDVLVAFFKYIKRVAEKQLGQSLENVPFVFSTPAVFSDNAKKALLRAAVRAGCNPLLEDETGGPLHSEPVCAIIRYAIQHKLLNQKAKVAVYDLGTGTFDVTFADTGADGSMNVLATEGVTPLGGAMIRDNLEALAYKLAAQKAGIKDFDPATLNADERFSFGRKVEQLLINMSRKPTAVMSVPLGANRQQAIEFNQEHFVSVLSPIADQMIPCIQKALAAAKLKYSDISYHVAVGGPMQVEYIQRRIEKETGATLRTDVNPALAVVEGLALIGHGTLILRGKAESFGAPTPKIRDVVPHNIGVILVRRSDGANVSSILFSKGMPVTARPTLRARLIYPHQTSCQILIVETRFDGEPLAECVVIGEGMLDNLPLETVMTDRLLFTASFNQAGVVCVTVKDLVSGKTVELTASMRQAA